MKWCVGEFGCLVKRSVPCPTLSRPCYRPDAHHGRAHLVIVASSRGPRAVDVLEPSLGPPIERLPAAAILYAIFERRGVDDLAVNLPICIFGLQLLPTKSSGKGEALPTVEQPTTFELSII